MIQRSAPLRRTSSLRRSRLRSRGRRAEREREALERFRRVVLARGACERCGSTRMLTAHHRRARSLGGGHDPETNGICLDWKCHRLIEDMAVPDWREWKDERGSNQ